MGGSPVPVKRRPLKPGQWICRNALLTTESTEQLCDILIDDGIVTRIDSSIDGVFCEEYDLTGKRVIPGCIDPHVHFSLPVGDRITVDDFDSGSLKALTGGVTVVFDFTTPEPGIPLQDTVRLRIAEADSAHCTVFLHATVVGWNSDIEQQAEQCLQMGVRSFKFFTTYEESGRRTTYAELEMAARWAKQVDARMIVHAEDQDSLVPATGFPSDSFKYYEASRPVISEVRAIEQLADIQRRTGAQMGIVHVSSGDGVDAAKESELFLETCSQYLVLTRDVFSGPAGWRYAVAPPLRSSHQLEKLWQAVSDQRIHWIGSDHAPFPQAEYDAAGDHFTQCPFGLDSVSLSLPRLMEHGISKGRITWPQLVTLTSTNAARFYGLFPKYGTIRVGSYAEFVVIAPGDQSISVLS